LIVKLKRYKLGLANEYRHPMKRERERETLSLSFSLSIYRHPEHVSVTRCWLHSRYLHLDPSYVNTRLDTTNSIITPSFVHPIITISRKKEKHCLLSSIGCCQALLAVMHCLLSCIACCHALIQPSLLLSSIDTAITQARNEGETRDAGWWFSTDMHLDNYEIRKIGTNFQVACGSSSSCARITYPHT